MPVSTPGGKESTDAFLARCISEMHKTDPKRPDKQIIAICYAQARQAGREVTAPVERTSLLTTLARKK